MRITTSGIGKQALRSKGKGKDKGKGKSKSKGKGGEYYHIRHRKKKAHEACLSGPYTYVYSGVGWVGGLERIYISTRLDRG